MSAKVLEAIMSKRLGIVVNGLLASALVFSQSSFAATGAVNGFVKRILATHDTYGHCMALLTSKDDSLSCSAWVTFDCEGNFEGNTKAAANNKITPPNWQWWRGNRL